ncbi:MAG TPA: hypothetical protein VLR46_11935 [Candidatus Dormibacteraeota bacterium]|nr:hypothetical protein [Candidatus Dormibacteraeota bacterium]
MSEIQLTRPTGYRIDSGREYHIFVDREKVGSIRIDETKVFTLSPGRHELQLKQDWASSEKLQFNLSEGEESQFVCGPRIKGNDVGMVNGLRVIYWVTFGCRRYIDLRPGDEIAASDSEPKRLPLGLDGPKLFGIALLIGIAYWVLMGNSIVAMGVVVAAMALVVGGLVGRGVGTVVVHANRKVQKRRGGEGSCSSE